MQETRRGCRYSITSVTGKPNFVARFVVDSSSAVSPTAQIHQQLVTYVHLGLLTRGCRLPTVRDLAARTGLNHKTAFRIYRNLAREDLVEIRPQQGVFVKFSGREAQHFNISTRGKFLQRVLRVAKQYNLSAMRVSRLLAAEAGARAGQLLRCAVLECNREQTQLFSSELTHKLGVDAFPVLTNSSSSVRELALRQADVFITTDFHWGEVTRWAARHHKEVFRIRLNPAFHRLLIQNAGRGLFPMILTDISFESAFRQALETTAPPTVLKNIKFISCRNRKLVQRLLERAQQAYVSPLCYDQIAQRANKRVRLVTLRDMISKESLQVLRRNLV